MTYHDDDPDTAHVSEDWMSDFTHHVDKLMEAVEENLKLGEENGLLSGHPDNPCCDNCQKMYAELMELKRLR